MYDEFSETYRLTDPVFVSPIINSFGPTDTGSRSIIYFFKNHKCSDICKDYKKPNEDFSNFVA